MKLNGYDVNITIFPLPRNCTECPFFYETWKDCIEGDAYCTLAPVSLWGCAIERPKECPLIEGKN